MVQSAYEIESFGSTDHLLMGYTRDCLSAHTHTDTHLNRKWKSNCYTSIIMLMEWAIHKAHNKLPANKPATGIKRTTSNEMMTKRRTNQIAYTHEFSFSVASKNPLIFQMNVAPSLEPAAIRLISRLNETRDQSQPTLKLSLLCCPIGPATNTRAIRDDDSAGRLYKYNCAHSHLNDFIIWFIRKSSNLIVSSRTQLSKYLQSLDRSSDVILPWSTISLAEQSVRVSQKRIFLS